MKQRAMRKRASKVLLVGAALVPLVWYHNPHHPYLWNFSWYTVLLLMALRPLRDLSPRMRWLQHWIPLRKELGILSATIVVTGAVFDHLMYNFSLSRYFSWDYWTPTDLSSYGHYALLVAFPLLITSNRWSMKKLKSWWKPVQRLSYIYFFGAAIFLTGFGKYDVTLGALFVFGITLVAFLKKTNVVIIK